ncbi:MAG: hypothetical protein IJD38_11875 [Clostridia bacterium]|nr:hypothetical protein [Clostridia bacterium]
MKPTLIRLSSLVLALLMLLPAALTACKPAQDPEDPTDSQDSVTESLPIDTETSGPDAFENTLLLAADGQTAYTVIVPDYAAAWELAAADRLVSTLAELGVTTTPSVDAATEATAREIVVGYTNRNSELADDFYAVGNAGYHIAAIGEKLFIGANTEVGMTAALDKLAADLISDGNRLGIKQGYVCKAVDESQPVAAPTLTGAYAESIAYAHSVANGVQGYFTDGDRGAFLMTNQTMTVINEMATAGNRQVSTFVNEYGVPYLRDTMSAYVEAGGKRLYSKDSTASGGMNIFLYGAYHYETHIRGQNFGDSRIVDESVEPVDMLKKVGGFGGHSATAVKDRKTGKVTITVESPDDPYINFAYAYKVDAEVYDALLVTMRTEYAADATFYLAAGSHGGIDGSQLVSFSVTPGEMRTYLVPLNNVTDYGGTLKSLRVDVGAKGGEVVEITEIKAVKTTSSDVPAVGVDRVLYTYPDKLHTAIHMVTTDEVRNMTAYGMETAIDKSRVGSLLVIDGKGEHTSLEGVDWSTATAVAFDIDRAGVFGYILTLDPGVGSMTVTERDGYYIIDQKAAAKSSYKNLEDIYLSQRIYNDATHDFEGFRKAVREERNPLTVTVTSKTFNGKSLGYDALRGSYRLELSGTEFNDAYYKNPDRHFRIDVEVKGDSADRNIYMYTHTANGALECAALLDHQNRVLPYLMQVCKNFQGENEEPIFDHDDPAYGETYFPMVVKSGETVKFSVLNLYQNWGIFPLKQISSIQFHIAYYHLSTGVTETNCIAPYYVYGKDKWTLPDFRAMSAPLWAGQPQHTSAGRLYFLHYTDAEGNEYASENTVDEMISHGPTYADIWMNYITDDGRISVDYRHMEMPQSDENRTYYEIRMKVLEDIPFKNFKKDFTFFSMDGRAVIYDTLGYLDENNQPVVKNAAKDGEPTFYKLGDQSPFVSYSYSSNTADYVNMAAVIKDYKATIGGEAYTGGILLEDCWQGLNYGRLTFDLGEVTLKAGDEIIINMILMPWGSPQVAKDDISNVLNVRNDTCLNPIKTEVKTGTLIPDVYMPLIRAEGQTAEFTLSGADNRMTVRVFGFEGYEKPTIEEYVDGKWVAYNTASETNKYDGYMVHYDGDGTYSFSFVVDMSGDVTRTFRVKR